MRLHFRFSIRVALSAIACVALGLTALRYANEFWLTVLNSILVLILLFAILASFYRTGASRAGWVGAALFGWSFLIMLQVPGLHEYAQGPIYAVSSVTYQRLLRSYSPKIVGAGQHFYVNADSEQNQAYVVIQDGNGGEMRQRITRTSYLPDNRSFVSVWFRISVFLMAFIGAVLGRYLYATRSGSTPPP
jgi:hypothetical protein